MANFKRNQIRAKAAKHKAQEGDHDSADDEPKACVAILILTAVVLTFTRETRLLRIVSQN